MQALELEKQAAAANSRHVQSFLASVDAFS